TYAGARGDTEQQMAQALHFTLPQEQLHTAWNALDLALANRGTAGAEEGQRFRLHVVNSLWGQADYGFRPTFLDLLALNYGAGLRTLDFKGSPDPSREAINRWVEEQTEQKIKDLLPPGSITPLTRLVLANAIYFDAAWQHPFQATATQDGPFHLLDGTSVTVPMMHESERLGYDEAEGWQVLELPYVGGELSMVILLPEAGTFETFAHELDAARLAAMLEGVARTQVALSLPRFTFESGMRLKDALSKLGMTQPFSMAADFTGMAARPELFIDDVYHKAFVAVDEKGTEAAAATGVVMDLKAMPARPVEVQVDRPFVFLIRDVQTGAILFLGHVVDPA
ncbi:MAG TPA: serpin family protein, partial [Anaerolineae bacterium]|nr:serpin family protein [Anaerolineae bacterium]